MIFEVLRIRRNATASNLSVQFTRKGFFLYGFAGAYEQIGRRISTIVGIGVAFLQPIQASGQSMSSTRNGSPPTFAIVQQAARAHKTVYQRIGNVFAEAQGRLLSDSDLDSYIDPSVGVADRKVAHDLMMMMPASRRGDFVLFNRNERRIISNNPAMLQYVNATVNNSAQGVSRRPVTQQKLSARLAQPNWLRPLDYSSPCSPPNPSNLQQVGGPFARYVSACGFTSGAAFVTVPFISSQFASGDAGHLYMEFQGSGIGLSSKSLIEGGLEYYNDSSVAPYLRSFGGYPNGYINMNNNAVRYTCGQNLAILHGATASGNYTYTNVGQLPGQFNPQVNWVNYGVFTLNNASWLFETSPGDIVGAGTDPAGIRTPCVTCSISQVTSIAQNNLPQGVGYSFDGSFFGIGSIGANINWMQVAFGEWESNCMPGASLCTFQFPFLPAIYSDTGGPQIFPDSTVADTFSVGLGWGAYETFDSISLTAGGIPQAKRRAQAALTEPAPPMPCSADSLQNCVVVDSEVINSYCHDHAGNLYNAYKRVYSVYRKAIPAKYLETATMVETAGPPSQNCPMTEHWSPGEPSLQYNDPSLP